MQNTFRLVAFCCFISILTAGCVYKRDLPQGNLITADMVSQLHPGMSRQHVQQIMGSPLLDDPFDASVWDYVYRLKTADGEIIRKRVTLSFNDGQLTNIEKTGDINASERATNEGAPASGAAIQPGEVVSPDQTGGY
ncbi:outer membrane protein assembly factor BamE [Kushneria phosphatilytica]|uniref:Outer membrane protein assembly factor BamE n=1 Tax=Kushneria phosphatilytica TaxID=657387 RepID=A0A1S1NW59_9GAMM|nr:outer membrane protein assembly factor BamE [Kushneria phosphatilytica]OHV11218.1 hypothetical protein BH688_07810 [Kushneria phosphatilytica]QEL12210.1 outer membrane protein assembly factor BamE [Kushneria phosphatilytica]